MKTLGSDRTGWQTYGGLLFSLLSCMLLKIPCSTKKLMIIEKYKSNSWYFPHILKY